MNVVDTLLAAAPDRVAVVHARAELTYGELGDAAGRVRAALRVRGIGPGRRVACACGTVPDFVVAYLGTLGAGAGFVPLNPHSPAAELEREQRLVSPDLVLGDPASVRALVAAGGQDVPVAAVADEDLALLLFTSGTAGTPRAAMLTHGNVRAGLLQPAALPDGVRPDDVVLGVLPLFHVFGLNVVLGLTLAAGARVVLVERFDPAATLDVIREHAVTVVIGAPAMWHAWAMLPDAAADAFASVRLALSGADRLPDEVAAAMHTRFGLHVHEGYGLTEASPGVTSTVGTDAPRGSIGRPLPGVELRLVDADGDDALVGDPGEIWVRGPNVFAGYWNDPDATAQALTADGWLRTGDLAVVDDERNLRIVDRVKDLVIVSGFNVHPAEVEAVIARFPGVGEAAVVGVPDSATGEALVAFVVAREGIDLDALGRHCRAELARYKCPSRVEIVDELPKGFAGKTLRRALRR